MNFKEYQLGTVETYSKNKYPIIYPALGLAGETGEVVEHIKKALRNEDMTISPERKEKLKYELGDVLWYISALAHDLGISLNEVAECNLVKLRDRKARNVIKSDGDNR